MQLTKVAFTKSNGGPSPTRTRKPQSRDPKIPCPFQDVLPRDRNAFRRDTVALSRRTDGQKDNAETLTGYIDALKSDVEALSRDLGAQKFNADVQKGNADAEKFNADVQKDNADVEKINADAQKINVFASKESPNGLICSSLHQSVNLKVGRVCPSAPQRRFSRTARWDRRALPTQHPESRIQYPVSSIQHPVTSI